MPLWIIRGPIWPEKRRTSTLWLTPICFSPATSRWPFGSTPVTTAVIVPLNSLLLAVVPAPAKVLLEVPATAARLKASELGETIGSAVMPAESLPLLSIELVLFCVAEIFSTIWTVIESPTRRAR